MKKNKAVDRCESSVTEAKRPLKCKGSTGTHDSTFQHSSHVVQFPFFLAWGTLTKFITCIVNLSICLKSVIKGLRTARRKSNPSLTVQESWLTNGLPIPATVLLNSKQKLQDMSKIICSELTTPFRVKWTNNAKPYNIHASKSLGGPKIS